MKIGPLFFLFVAFSSAASDLLSHERLDRIKKNQYLTQRLDRIVGLKSGPGRFQGKLKWYAQLSRSSPTISISDQFRTEDLRNIDALSKSLLLMLAAEFNKQADIVGIFPPDTDINKMDVEDLRQAVQYIKRP